MRKYAARSRRRWTVVLVSVWVFGGLFAWAGALIIVVAAYSSSERTQMGRAATLADDIVTWWMYPLTGPVEDGWKTTEVRLLLKLTALLLASMGMAAILMGLARSVGWL